ncbi:hypothetical protein H6P81_017587 [Aristolochia fimbriata]|uniref:DUF547 domain-containing protein n=1 Tax=Aristolochia fimbriata TaxID=158543 RepID=A0AAV7DZC8_ARIFI|nr:hypothetical protein H6P81_017587 [Aristolochia fimbriata]
MASPMRQKPTNAKKKKTELEKEVAKLQKILDHEEKVNVYLKSAVYDQSSRNLSHIPSFLPPKMKELVAELAMVESEIARLEAEITNLQRGLDDRVQEVRETPTLKQNQTTTTGGRLSDVSASDQPSTFRPRHPTPRPSRNSSSFGDGWHLRQASEARAMYFINQAIKGDYPVNNFSKNDKSGSWDDLRKNNQEMSTALKKSGGVPMERPLSTQKLPPKPAKSSKLPQEQDSNMSFNMVFSSLPADSTSLGEATQKWQPNKLSETIMKCLICIFTRLIRTTRVISMEVEKSAGVITRSAHSSPILSRSFRSENSSSSKSGLLVPKPDFGQQDPYGIFVVEDSLPRDIGPYKNYVKFTSSSFDPKSISSCVPLLSKLRALMGKLHDVDLRYLTYQQKLAFWINMYNACIMHGFLQFGLPSSPDKTLSLMNKAVLSIGGNKLNALAIERFILRRSIHMTEIQWKGEKDDMEDVVRRIYGLEYPEPNVTFALSCGTRSSPAVRIYTAEGISNELEKSKLEYLQASIVVKSTKTVVIPRLLTEFGKDTDSLVEWVCDQLPTSCSLRKSMVECYRGQGSGKIKNVAEIMPYEFYFQYLLVV